MSSEPTLIYCGKLTDDARVCGSNDYCCGECLTQPVKTEDFAAEVSGGWLLVAIKIPTVSCAVCGVVYTPEVRPIETWHRFRGHNPIDVHASPWCGAGWKFIENGKPYPHHNRALVCGTCAAPVTAAEKENSTRLAEQTAAVAARVTRWER